jgi:hypothetical protein
MESRYERQMITSLEGMGIRFRCLSELHFLPPQVKPLSERRAAAAAHDTNQDILNKEKK